MTRHLIAICAVLAVSAPFGAAAQAQAAGEAKAALVNAKGEPAGTATLTETPNGMLVTADLTGLPPGPHGFHVHAIGKCDAATGFKSAGGHFNPTNAKHGYLVEGGPHLGDLPNQVAGADGKMTVRAFAPNLSLAGKNALLDGDGAAIVVHAGADDYRTQDAGDSGDRIACGILGR